MYFNDRMFNPDYVNRDYYIQLLTQQQTAIYKAQQSAEVMKAEKAMHDLCSAVKKMDESHQQEAFFTCLAVMAQEFGWQ